MNARNVLVSRALEGIFVLVVVGYVQTSTLMERMENRCRQYAESVFEILEDPILLPGAQPKSHDTCRISSQTIIVGGEEAQPQEFPHMALIGYGRSDRIEWRCGGSLISERWVVSAAHCVKTPNLARFVKLGDLDFQSTEDEDRYDSSPETFSITEWAVHPDYKPPQVYNDIALFQINATVEFSRFIRPICLLSFLPAENSALLASGWGATSYGGSSSSQLLKAGLDVVRNDECRQMYPITAAGVRKVLANGVNEETQICAKRIGKDTCQGDSGGPLQRVLREPYCMYSLVGVTSIGNKCGARLAGIFTRVDSYLPWIESKVWPEAAASASSLPQAASTPASLPPVVATSTFLPQAMAPGLIPRPASSSQFNETKNSNKNELSNNQDRLIFRE